MNKRRKLHNQEQTDGEATPVETSEQAEADRPQQLKDARLVAAAVKQHLGIATGQHQLHPFQTSASYQAKHTLKQVPHSMGFVTSSDWSANGVGCCYCPDMSLWHTLHAVSLCHKDLHICDHRILDCSYAVADDVENVKSSDQAALPGDRMRVRHVQRRPDIEAVRSELPISGMEQEVMECILENDVVVLCGETGCGKTTQVSFLCVFWTS